MPLLTVAPSEDGTALLKWQPPPAGLSPVLGYRLSYGQADPASDSFMVQELNAEERTYNRPIFERRGAVRVPSRGPYHLGLRFKRSGHTFNT